MTDKQCLEGNKALIDIINQNDLTMYSYGDFSKTPISLVTQTDFLSSFKNDPNIKNANIITHGENYKTINNF